MRIIDGESNPLSGSSIEDSYDDYLFTPFLKMKNFVINDMCVFSIVFSLKVMVLMYLIIIIIQN